MDENGRDMGRLLWSLVAAAVLAASVPFLASGASTVRTAPDDDASTKAPLYVEVGLASGNLSVYRVPVGTSVAGLFATLGLPRPPGPDGDRPLVSGESIALAKDGGLRRGVMAGSRLVALGLPVPVNSASPADLAAVPGIGATLSLRIATERATRGDFKDMRELVARVHGLGETTAADLETYLAF